MGKKLIGDILENYSGNYQRVEKNILLSLGEDKDFFVDFLIKRKDGQDAIINYVGFDKNLNTETSNRNSLNLFKIKNLYLFRLPDDEARKKINDFINKGYE